MRKGTRVSRLQKKTSGTDRKSEGCRDDPRESGPDAGSRTVRRGRTDAPLPCSLVPHPNVDVTTLGTRGIVPKRRRRDGLRRPQPKGRVLPHRGPPLPARRRRLLGPLPLAIAVLTIKVRSRHCGRRCATCPAVRHGNGPVAVVRAGEGWCLTRGVHHRPAPPDAEQHGHDGRETPKCRGRVDHESVVSRSTRWGLRGKICSSPWSPPILPTDATRRPGPSPAGCPPCPSRSASVPPWSRSTRWCTCPPWRPGG